MEYPTPSPNRRWSWMLISALLLVGGAAFACISGALLTLFDIVPGDAARTLGQLVGYVIAGSLLGACVLIVLHFARKRST